MSTRRHAGLPVRSVHTLASKCRLIRIISAAGFSSVANQTAIRTRLHVSSLLYSSGASRHALLSYFDAHPDTDVRSSLRAAPRWLRRCGTSTAVGVQVNFEPPLADIVV